MARKFSLKNNTIFQKTEPPEPPEDIATEARIVTEISTTPFALPSPESTIKGQILPLKNRTSNSAPQNLIPKEERRQQGQEENSFISPSHFPSSAVQKPSDDLNLKDHFDKSQFFSFYNEMSDELLPTLNAAEQVLYHRLFRLAYGFNRNYCTVSQAVLEDRTNLSRNTIRTAMQSLINEGLIRIVESNNRVSTTYRVLLLREKRNRGSIFEEQILTLKNRESESDAGGGQISEVQNLTPRNENILNILKKDDIYRRVAKFEGQDLTPLLSLTNRSFTLSHSTTMGEGQNLISREDTVEQALTPVNLHLWARELVNRFYSLLGQRVTKKKREKNLQECITLLQEDRFSVEEIDYAISWLVAHHPTTGDFSRLSYFIGQALKDREKNQRTAAAQRQQSIDTKKKQEEEHKTRTEQQKFEEIKSSISPKVIEDLTEEARRLVMQQHPKGGIGQEILVRLKLEELIKDSKVAGHNEAITPHL